MTDDQSLDRAARSWLEEGPTRAPDQAVAAALSEIQTTSQERELQLPWRLPPMNVRTLGAAVATVAVVVALLALGLPRLTGSGSGLTPSPSASPLAGSTSTLGPTAASTSTPTVAPTPFPSFAIRQGPPDFTDVYASPLYRYGLRYPATWTLAAGEIANAPDDLPELGSVPSRADLFSDGNTLGLMVTAGPVSATRGDLSAFSAYVAARIPSSFTIYAGANCSRSVRALSVDGEAANEVDVVCPERAALWLTTIHAGRAYQVVWLVDAPFTAADLRPAFDRFLQSFTFAP